MSKTIFQNYLFYFFCFLLFFQSDFLFAQGSIKGKITDIQQKPFSSISISLQNTTLNTLSNEEGFFELSNVPNGKYTLLITGLSIENINKNIEMTDNSVLNLENIIISEKTQILPDAIIIAKKEISPLRKVAEIEGTQLFASKKVDVINLTDIDANLINNNARQIFARTPGVNVWENDGSGIQVGVSVRGLSPNRSWEFNVRQNGYDVSSDIFGYPEAYYNPPMEAVKEIQMVRGAASLQFGAQFGGSLNYMLKTGDKNKPFAIEVQNTAGSFGLTSTFIGMGGTKGKWNYYGYVQNRSADGWRQNSRYNIQHYHAQVNYQINQKMKIGLEYTQMDYQAQQAGGLTDTQFNQNAQQSFRARNWFGAPWHLYALNFDYQISQNLKLNTKIFGLIGERNSVGFVPSAGILALDNNSNRQIDRDYYQNIGTETRLIYTYELFGKKHNLATGARASWGNTFRKQNGIGTNGSDFNLGMLDNTDFGRVLHFETKNLAFFAENMFQINKKWTITPGFRFDYIESTSEGRLSFNTNGTENLINPQFAARQIALLGIGTEFKITENTSFYSNFSQSFRPVYYSELTPPATTDVIDPNMKDANGFNFDLGYKGQIQEFLRFDVNYFRLQYNDRVGVLTLARPDNSRYQYRTNVGNSTHEGIESYIEFTPTKIQKTQNKWGDIQIFGSLSLMNAKYNSFQLRTFNTTTNQFVETNLAGNRVENAPQSIQRIGASYLYKGFSFTYQYSKVGEVFADATNTETPTTNGVSGKILGYEVMDISASYVFLTNYSLKFSVNNLTNQMYFTRRAGGYPGPGLLPSEARSFYLTFGIKF
ncbi:MAG: TonB-dependent receptor [Bacteroidetes bacterium]|nr:MAG: TonB-dependent receptor [Bacteroidota bacterium]TAG88153.1 MAG: TonB-dependent receptor [Bacteroidota bacterium]